MQRSIALVFAVLALTSGAAAQGGAQAPSAPRAGAFDTLIDFVLRPSQAAEEEEEDIWDWDREPEPSLLESEIGPPIAGPTGEEAIGPTLAGPGTTAEERARARRGRTLSASAFDPIGIRVGSFIIRPSIEIGMSATDNVTGAADGPNAVGLLVAPEVTISSEDDRHRVEVELSGEGVFYEDDAFNTSSAAARIGGRYDLTSRTTIVGEGGYAQFREDFTDPDTPGGAAERPLVQSFDATLGIEQRIGRFSLTPSGFVDRTINDDVPLTGGGVASRRELDSTEYGGRLRAAFALGAGVAPFVEVTGGVRDFDQEVDNSGFRRSSVWGELSGGLVIDRGDKLRGEVSLGYHHEELDDGRLSELEAFLANAAIVWSPRRLTEVQFDFSTDVQTTSVAGEAGSVVYAGVLTLARQVSPRVLLAGGGGVEYEYVIGGDREDVTFTGFAEASYAFNRMASLAARYEYEQEESSEPGGDSKAHTVEVRVRLQR